MLCNLKESVNDFIVTFINNRVSINVVSRIYHPPPPTPMITEIKIITYVVTLKSVPEKYAKILTVITVHKTFTALFLLLQ